ncbi:MAG: UDP-N-acetylmuramate dehydrogenase [Candidatus Zixiibacteriota bacterium]|nr:MAG: UDP-N-acetylmuramate dehydrogenase [candidate division Zixibacteria bacterium]
MVEQVKVSRKIPRADMVAAFGDTLEFDKPLAPLTSYRTGGPARFFIAVSSSEQLVGTVKQARELKIPFFIIGGGSNLLVSDSGYDGLIIKVAIMSMAVSDESRVECGAGEDLMALVDFATTNALTGVEFAAGIWGTVGGAIYGNAGAYGGEMKDVVYSLELVDSAGKVKVVGPDYCRFGYRDSNLKATREIVTTAVFQLKRGDKVRIEDKVNEILAMRRERHPTQGHSAGCFFKNIPDPDEEFGKLPAGRLLDQVGAKGLSVGGAAVFEKHANIIVNRGGATSKDIRKLADTMKKRVLDEFGITLEEEVIQLGEF